MTTLMTAALPSSAAAPVHPPAHPSAGSAIGLPTGLTDVDAARIAAAISAARTESTRTVYAHAWRGWERWCASRGIPTLPGDPLALCAYLTERAESGIATSTLDLACTALRHVHRIHGAEDPVASETVRQVRLGLRRTYGGAPRRLARPLTVTKIHQIVASIDRTTPIGKRDAAIILLGFASALRRSELTGAHPCRHRAQTRPPPAQRAAVQDRPGRPRPGRGRRPRQPRGHRSSRSTRRLAVPTRRRSRGAVHPHVGQPRQSRSRLRPRRRPDAPRPRRSPGLDGTRITAHSLRAGHATTAALAGVPLDRIAAQTRHKDLSVLVNRYIRLLEALATTLSRDLGL